MLQTLLAVFLALLALVQTEAQAQELFLLAGQLKVDDSGERSFGANLSYRYKLGQYGALSASYLNEGHPTLHHRDGLSSQLWARSGTHGQGLSLAGGIGPYFYFDTTTGSGAATDYRNEHGWGALYTLSAKWQTGQPWFVELQANRIRVRGQQDTSSLLLGVGLALQAPAPDRARPDLAPGENSFTLSAGRTIVNSFASERSGASALEYRRTLTADTEWSAMWLDEGAPQGRARKGVATQFWLMRPLSARFVLEMGAGIYGLSGQLEPVNAEPGERSRLAGLASVGVRYRLSPQWRAQLRWSRIITNDHRDADVILLGIGAAL